MCDGLDVMRGREACERNWQGHPHALRVRLGCFVSSYIYRSMTAIGKPTSTHHQLDAITTLGYAKLAAGNVHVAVMLPTHPRTRAQQGLIYPSRKHSVWLRIDAARWPIILPAVCLISVLLTIKIWYEGRPNAVTSIPFVMLCHTCPRTHWHRSANGPTRMAGSLMSGMPEKFARPVMS